MIGAMRALGLRARWILMPPRLAAAVLALAPALAHANAGIGYLMIALPVVVIALVPAVPLEAAVLKPILQVPWRRAFALSLGANIRSTLWGLALAVAVDFALIGAGGSAGPDPAAGAAIAMLVPFFFLSWWIEHRAVARKAAEIGRRRIAAATGAANALSYAGMIAFVALGGYLPWEGSMAPRARISAGLAAASSLKAGVTERWGADRKFPAPGTPGFAPVVEQNHRVALERDGRVSVHFAAPGFPSIDGKRIVLTPVPDPSGAIARWQCGSPDIERRFLPGSCRDTTP